MQNDLRHLRSVVSSLTRDVAPGDRVAFAQAFSARSLAEYCRRVCPRAPALKLPKSGVSLRAESVAEALRLGRLYATMDEPVAAYLLGTLYTLALPDDLRAGNGMYFTPPVIVDRLLDMVEAAGGDWVQHTVIDPAAGGGAFVTPLAMRMAAALQAAGATAAEAVEHISSHLSGIEIDPFSGWMANVFLNVALWDLCEEAGQRLPPLVTTADSLRHDLGKRRYDVVIGNPPYGRVTLEPELRRRYARSLYGHANLYGLFTDLAVQLCRPGGVIGYVTPASFLGGQYFKNLRALLAAEAPPVAIDFISKRAGVFDKVLQETVLIALVRGSRHESVSVCTSQLSGIGERYRKVEGGDFRIPENEHAPWVLPRDAGDVDLLRHAAGMPHRLQDYGLVVSTGPLVWNRHKEQLTTSKGRNGFPLIWSESVLPSGEFSFSFQRRNHQPFFIWRPGQDHLLMRQPAVLVQRTTAKEQHRRLFAAIMPARFIEEHGAAVVENHLNMIYPADGDCPISLRAVSALLNSSVADRIFRCINGSVAVSAFELESLPLPPPEIMHELDAMLERRESKTAVEDFLSVSYRNETVGVAA
jgi:adenine-specific DNA-methyltransferase